MHRLKFGDVCLKRGLVTVDAAASKTRMRRLVPLHGKAVAWLSRCQMKPDDPIVPQSRSQPHTTAIAQFAGLKWSHDLLRHSCASYMLALHQDAAKVSRWLGNSIPILTNHYMELVQPDDCRRFWKYRFEKTRKIVPPNATTTPQRTATQVPSVLWLDCSQTVSA
jgi:site-specific recombinase XerD